MKNGEEVRKNPLQEEIQKELLVHGFFSCSFLRIPPDRMCIITALSYNRDEPDDQSTPEECHGLYAPFARRNYYREATVRLKESITALKGILGISVRKCRFFSNSRFPEKAMASQSGIGFNGRNSLIITPEQGSLCVIAGVVLPGDIPESLFNELSADIPQFTGSTGGLSFGSECGSCTACIEACPGNAITMQDGIIRDRCIQNYTVSMKIPNRIKAIWGKQLYGCQICQKVCPKNAVPCNGIEIHRGELGPSVALGELLETGLNDQDRELYIKETVLDRSWIDFNAVLRNAMLIAGKWKRKDLTGLIKTYGVHPDKGLQLMANWSLTQIL